MSRAARTGRGYPPPVGISQFYSNAVSATTAMKNIAKLQDNFLI